MATISRFGVQAAVAGVTLLLEWSGNPDVAGYVGGDRVPPETPAQTGRRCARCCPTKRRVQ